MKKELRTLMLLISDHLFTNKSQGNRPYADEPQHVIIQQQVSRLFISSFNYLQPSAMSIILKSKD